MYSVMMTGYMFKNAQYRLELQQSLEQVALPDAQDKKAISFPPPPPPPLSAPALSLRKFFCIATLEEEQEQEHRNC